MLQKLDGYKNTSYINVICDQMYYNCLQDFNLHPYQKTGDIPSPLFFTLDKGLTTYVQGFDVDKRRCDSDYESLFSNFQINTKMDKINILLLFHTQEQLADEWNK